MRLTRWTLAVGGWLVCVGAVAAAAWYAIDSAGHQVEVLTSDPVRARESLSSPGSSSTPAPSPTTAGPSVSPTTLGPPTATSAGAGAEEPAGEDSPQAGTTAPPRRPSAGLSSSTRPSSRSSAPPPTTTWRTPRDVTTSDTLFTRGGSVSVTCRPGEEMDYTVKPAQGWGASAEKQGAEEATVWFRRGDDVIDVHAACVDDRPQLVADTHSDD